MQHGLQHANTISNPLLLRLIRDLVCHGPDFFEANVLRTQFDLELHLRCIIASLRLLRVSENGRGLWAPSFHSFRRNA